MPLLALSHVTHTFGGPVILDDVTLAIEKGRKIGVIGQNGTGKSTLLRVLAGVLHPTAGDVIRHPATRLEFQAQELTYAPGATVRDEMRRVFRKDLARGARLAELERTLADTDTPDEQRPILAEYARLQAEHHASGGYDIDRRIATVLSSLGLPQDAWDQPVDQFSGGERNIIGLAGVLLGEPDVMLLDEPSNHLDMEGIEWFSAFVRRTEAAVVMVSHNRHLLDETTDEIWEVRGAQVISWTGNYSAFREQKAKALELQERQYKAQQRTIGRLEFQARRLRDMANAYDDPGQAKRYKSMMRRIERMEKVDRPDRAEDRFHGSLRGGSRHGRVALAIDDLSLSFGERSIFEHASLHLEYGDRVCLVGANGSGKTTLLRRILEHGHWDNPEVRLGKSVKVGEYSQLHDDVLDGEQTLLRWVAAQTGLHDPEAAALLHRFLFAREDLDRPVKTLSGGEKSRLQIASLVHGKVNFLLLDEPTNHLDIQGCEQLEAMLQEFQGTLLVISHDRYFLESLVNSVVEVRDRRLDLFRGTFEQWWESKTEARDSRRKGALELHSRKEAAGDEMDSAKHLREERKERQRRERQLRTQLGKVERRITELETRQDDLTMVIQEAYQDGGNPPQGPQWARDLAQVRDELERANRDGDDAVE